MKSLTRNLTPEISITLDHADDGWRFTSWHQLRPLRDGRLTTPSPEALAARFRDKVAALHYFLLLAPELRPV